MHHSANAFVSASMSLPPFAYRCVNAGVVAVNSIIAIVMPASSAMAKVMSLLSRSSASSSLSVRTIWGTSTALKMPPEISVKITCGIIEPA